MFSIMCWSHISRYVLKVVLGMEEDLAGAGYNVNQSKIAIGSGRLMGGKAF